MLTKILFCLIAFPLLLGAQEIPRTVIAIYNKDVERNRVNTRLHQAAEMPCNHLGLIFEYYEVHEPMPDLKNRSDVVGVICWLVGKPELPRTQAIKFFEWSIEALDLGKKYLVMGEPYFLEENLELPLKRLNVFWEKLGLRSTGQWVDDTFQSRLRRIEPQFTGFERDYPSVTPGFLNMYPVSDHVHCLLKALAEGTGEFVSCLVTFSDTGGYVADGYGIYYLFEKGKDTRKWYLNPFLYFAQVFGTDFIPKLDTTTLAGRRIYYSHIDGDGWNNETEIREFPARTISAIVVYDKILKGYPDLPVTVAPIGADIDSAWVAKRDSQEIARKMFALPNVEVSSHTFTHPFDWGFFKDYREQDEVPYLHLYPNGSWLGGGLVSRVSQYFYGSGDTIEEEQVKDLKPGQKTFDEDYTVPRAFALKPFDLDLEVAGSVDLINTLSDEKKVVLYQWSGDCEPFYEALAAVKKLDILNINGGDSRFDNVYSSYAWVAPLGRQVNGLRQVYASNSNENLYTDLWTTNFFGFNLLPQTFKNTESPIRIRPINLYYHVYSAQKNASLKALQQNLEYILTQEVIPIKASQFPDLVMGFYEAKIEKKGKDLWGISGRRSLQTVRFDQGALLGVDDQRSQGVIGHRHYQGSLYVSLDAAVDEAVIAIKRDLAHDRNYSLIQSKWQISHLNRDQEKMTVQATGFGDGEMAWNVPKDGQYVVTTDQGTHLLVTSKNRQIKFVIQESALNPITIEIKKGEL